MGPMTRWCLVVAFAASCALGCAPLSAEPLEPEPTAPAETPSPEPSDPEPSPPEPTEPECPTLSPDAPRAVVVAVNREGPDDGIVVYAIDPDGKLHDRHLAFWGINNPRQITLRADGCEALVAYGRIDGPFGVAVLALRPDGSHAYLKQTLELGMDELTSGVAYGTKDHAVLASKIGPTGHTLHALERKPDGFWTQGPQTPIPGDWPIDLMARPGTEQVVMMRVDLSTREPTEFLPLHRTEQGWVRAGQSGLVEPATVSMAAHPSGQSLYSGTSDPLRGLPVPGGFLNSFRFDGADLKPMPAFSLPHDSAALAVAPDGRSVVLESPIVQKDPNTNQVSVRSYRFLTVSLGEDGQPRGPVHESAAKNPGLLSHDFRFSPHGHLVIAREHYPNQAGPDGNVYPLQVWSRDAQGEWKQVGEPIPLAGLPSMAIAP